MNLDAISEAKRAAVRAALATTFDNAAIDTMVPLSGGTSGAQLFRVEAGARRALLRVEGSPSPLRNPHQYASLKLAADAGIAPALLYVDEPNGVAVMDFVVQQPLVAFPGGKPALIGAVARMLRRLQAAPLFPYFVEYPDIVERLFAHVRRTGLFADGLLDPHFERLVRLTERYAQDRPPMVSSHNDLNLRNILFDGTRLWLIDWESAYRNDPLTDVAVLLDNLAASPDEEAALLAAWHGGAPDRAMRERLDVVRALTRLYYAGVLLSAAAALPHDAPDRDLAAPSTDDFIAMVRARSLTSHTPQTVHLLGKIYLASFLSGARVPPLDVL